MKTHRTRDARRHPARWAALVVFSALTYGLLAYVLLPRHTAAHAAQRFDQGRALYWQIKHTRQVHRPFKLLHELYSRAEDKPTVMQFLALQPGMTAADIGCGAGYFTLDMARVVGPTGTVLATDIQEESIEFLKERIHLLGCEGCGEIRTWVNDIDDARLPPDGTDVALLANLIFYAFPTQLPENVRMLETTLRGLKLGGRAVVVQDLAASPGGTPEALRANFEAVGFRTLNRLDIGERSVLFVFQR